MYRSSILIFTALICSGCALQPKVESIPNYGEYARYENNKKGFNKLMFNHTVKGFEEYSTYPENKAFAQSLTGAWGWIADATTVEHAKTAALANCQSNNTETEFLYPCEIININGKWVEE